MRVRIVTKEWPAKWWQPAKRVTYIEADLIRLGPFSTPQDAETALHLAEIRDYEIVKEVQVMAL